MNTTGIVIRSARVGFAFFSRVVSVGLSVKVTFEQRLEGCGGEPYRDNGERVFLEAGRTSGTSNVVTVQLTRKEPERLELKRSEKQQGASDGPCTSL